MFLTFEKKHAVKRMNKKLPAYKDIEVSSLSDEELFQHLFQLGVEVGPIVASTRALYRNKLEKILNGKKEK